MHFLWTLLGVCSGMKFHRIALGWTPVNALTYLLKLALLLALLGTPIVIRNSLHTADAVFERLDNENVLPAFSIEHGRARSAVPQPYCHRFQDFAFVLDTTSATPLVATGATAGITVTADNVLFWSEIHPHPEPIPLNIFPDGRVNGAYLGHLLRESLPWMGILTAMAVFAGFFCAAILQVLVFGGVAAFVEQGIEPGYHFNQLFCFGVLALTPAAVAALVYTACGIGLDHLSLVYFLVFAFYFTGATTVCRVLLLPPGTRMDGDDL